MNSINLQTIKRESIRLIFEEIVKADKLSRSEITNKTGISLVTVGKVADAFLEMKIITQEKEARPQAGRRAGIIQINPALYSIILDFTATNFKLSIINMHLQIIDSSSFQCEQFMSFSDNIMAFISETEEYVKNKYGIEYCFGIGVICPTPTNPSSSAEITGTIPAINLSQIRQAIESSFKQVPIIIDSNKNCSALFSIKKLPDYTSKSIVYFNITQSDLWGTIYYNGKQILGYADKPSDFGNVIDINGQSINEKISLSKSIDDYCGILSYLIQNLTKLFNPCSCVLEYDLPYSSEELSEQLKHNLINFTKEQEDTLPLLICNSFNQENPTRGLCLSLREQWLSEVVFSSYGCH